MAVCLLCVFRGLQFERLDTEGQVITFPLDSLDPRDPMAGLRRGKRITTHISFFKCGVCLNKTLVCVVKASALSSTIKVLEPIDSNTRGRNKPTFKKLIQGGNDTLRTFKVASLVAFTCCYIVLNAWLGVLYPRAVEFDTLLEDATMHRLHEWLRDRRS